MIKDPARYTANDQLFKEIVKIIIKGMVMITITQLNSIPVGKLSPLRLVPPLL